MTRTAFRRCLAGLLGVVVLALTATAPAPAAVRPAVQPAGFTVNIHDPGDTAWQARVQECINRTARERFGTAPWTRAQSQAWMAANNNGADLRWECYLAVPMGRISKTYFVSL